MNGAKKKRRKDPSRKINRIVIIAVVGVILIAVIIIIANLLLVNSGGINPIAAGTHRSISNNTSLGNPNAPVKMDVWEDFQCSGCRSYTQSIEPSIIKNYVDSGKLFYTFHYYPFLDGGQGESRDSALAANCAAEQNRFWDYHDILFANWKGENAGSYTRPRLNLFAKEIGLNLTAFAQCIDSPSYPAQIQQDLDFGRQMGVPPTPGIFVDGKKMVSSEGPHYIPSYADISRAIDAAGV
jgi:protein-disulfide isomerase